MRHREMNKTVYISLWRLNKLRMKSSSSPGILVSLDPCGIWEPWRIRQQEEVAWVCSQEDWTTLRQATPSAGWRHL